MDEEPSRCNDNDLGYVACIHLQYQADAYLGETRVNRTQHPGPMPSWEEVPGESELRLVPLGGLGEFGMNSLAIHTANSLVLVDCGQLFPGEDQPGIDSIIPDFAYLEPFSAQLDAVLMTHGHEDHIGALPYLLERWPVPVYGSHYSIALLKHKLKEREIKLPGGYLRPIADYQRVPIGWGEIQAEFIPVAHSIPGACAIALHTPRGVIVHSGDWKLDPEPVDGRTTGMERFQTLGEEGVLLLLGDSTNVMEEGHSPSESVVKPGLRRALEQTVGRLFVSPFSTNIHRIQTLLDLAMECGRRVCIVGRSLERNIHVSIDLGLLRLHERFVDYGELDAWEPSRLLVILTGTQGEPQSALGRLLRGELKGLSIGHGDRLVMSSRSIPGNEVAIRRTLDMAARLGAETVLMGAAPLHATGHAHREDLRTLLEALRPTYMLPAHGTYQNLREHARLARSLGWSAECVILMDSGDCLLLDASGKARIAGSVPAGKCFVDQGVSHRVDARVVRDRLILQEDGIVVATLLVDPETATLVSEPAILSRGFVFPSDDPAYAALLQSTVRNAFEEAPREVLRDRDLLLEYLRQALRRIIRKTTQNRPLVVPLLLDVRQADLSRP